MSGNERQLAAAGRDADGTFDTAPVGRIGDLCPPNVPRLTLHVDADRDGKVDTEPAEPVWEYGIGKKGAVILCNNDDDDGDKKLDHADDKIDTDIDVSDIAPLVVRRTPKGLAFPAGYRAFLRVSNKDRIRIFKPREGNATEIIGPTAGKDTYEILDLTRDEITFGMEALIYPRPAFEGHVDISLEVRAPNGSPCGWHQTRLRVAPWMMPNHLDPTETVYVMDMGAPNQRFRNDLETAVAKAGNIKTQELPGGKLGNDRWVQDVMEIGFSSFPRLGAGPDATWNMPVVLRTPNERGRQYPNPKLPKADDFPKQALLGPDFGYHQVVDPEVVHFTSLNSFGNLECSPPVMVNNRPYPFGRIVYGTDPDKSRTMHSLARSFLAAQRVQSPFTIDTGWLQVGHVDELISFCPMASAPDIPKFRVLIASPALALDVLRSVQQAGNGSAPMFVVGTAVPGYQGIHVPSGESFQDFTYFLKTPDQILANNNKAFLDLQSFVQTKIDGVQRQVADALGLSDEHFIRLPVLFYEVNDDGKVRYKAYSPDVVNMLVVTKADGKAVLVIPKPFGPVVGTACKFEEKVNAQLAPLTAAGNVIQYVDDFVNYHQGVGEIHCATNSKRKPRTDIWWWEADPA